MRPTIAFAAALLSLAWAAVGSAQEYHVGDIEVGQPWARASATPQARTGAAYMTLVNKGEAPDRLVGISTPAAERVELHTHDMDGNVMRMRKVEAIEVAPGEPVVLQPGGLHVMMVGLRQPLRPNDRVPLTLSFQRSGSVDVEVVVGSVASMSPEHAPPARHTH